MLNLGYKNWLVPYVEGTLDARRTAILESRIKVDPALAAEVQAIRMVDAHLRASAGADKIVQTERAPFLAAQPSVWPRVEDAITSRRGGFAYAPRFAPAAGLAVVAIAAVYWVGGGHNQTLTRTSPHQIAKSSMLPSMPPVLSPLMPLLTPSITGLPKSPAKAEAHPPVTSPAPVMVADNSDTPSTHRRDLGVPRLALSTDTGAVSKSTGVMVDLHGDLQSPFAEDHPVATTAFENTASDGSPVVAPAGGTAFVSDHVVSTDTYTSEGSAISTPVTNGAVFNSTVRPGDALIGMGGHRSFGARGPKVLTSGADFMAGSNDVNFSNQEDASLTTLRQIAVEQIDNAKPNTVHDALNSWRDTLLVDLNTSVEQNSTRTAQAEESIDLLRKTSHLPDFYAVMKDECQSRPAEVASWRIIGHVDTALGLTADAVDAWIQVSESNSATAEDWYQLGLACEANKNAVGAMAAYKQVVQIGEPSRTADVDARLAALVTP